MGELAKRADDHIGKRIRERRVTMGLRQQDLADALNISYQQLQKYEIGANRITVGRLYEIARRLEVDVAHFFDGLDPTSERVPMAHGGRERSTIELARNFAGISNAALRSALSSMIKTLSRKGLR